MIWRVDRAECAYLSRYREGLVVQREREKEGIIDTPEIFPRLGDGETFLIDRSTPPPSFSFHLLLTRTPTRPRVDLEEHVTSRERRVPTDVAPDGGPTSPRLSTLSLL